MVTLKQGDVSQQRGVWAKSWKVKGKNTALISCPFCNRTISLDDYQITKKGVVSPNVECPYACGFAATVILEGWLE